MSGMTDYKARPEGPFLISIGITLLVAMTFADTLHPHAHQNIFLLGMAVSFVVLFGTGFLQGFPRPRPIQRAAIFGSVILELALFMARPHVTGQLTAAGDWIAALLIVGIHFIPFAIALGFELAVLGVLCILNATLAMTSWSSPVVWLTIDAALKIGIGAWICLSPRVPVSATAGVSKAV